MSEGPPKSGPVGRAAWKELLSRHDIRPDRRLGQNFLFDASALEKVVKAAELDGDETVLEIGAGVGSLTRLLAQRAQRVVAVEFDQRLMPALREVVSPYPNIRIVEGDILSLELANLVGRANYQVVANIPYNITSAVIRKLMEAANSPDRVVLTIQREVAERIVAEPREMSLLALSVQIYGEPSVQDHISRTHFYPAPDVDSAVLRIDLRRDLPLPNGELESLFMLARAGFQQRRKQLRNSLGHGTSLTRGQVDQLMESVGISSKRRPQSLRVEDWVKLTSAYLDRTRTGEGDQDSG